jgi:hypothetical protein
MGRVPVFRIYTSVVLDSDGEGVVLLEVPSRVREDETSLAGVDRVVNVGLATDDVVISTVTQVRMIGLTDCTVRNDVVDKDVFYLSHIIMDNGKWIIGNH